MVKDEWFMERFIEIEKSLGRIENKVDNCVTLGNNHTTKLEEQDERLDKLEDDRGGPSAKTIGAAGGIGTISAVVIAIGGWLVDKIWGWGP